MRRLWMLGLFALLVVHSYGTGALAQEAAPECVPDENQGDSSCRIGWVVVALQQRFTVPGRILGEASPIQNLAVAGAGFKIYESLIELDATAHEFKTACGLIGLQPGRGDIVNIRVSWEIDGATTQVNASDLVRLGGTTLPSDGWVYTGSTYTHDGALRAHLDGTLIGFVHDPASLIDHGVGFTEGDSKTAEPNRSVLPPAETRMTLTVERR